MSRWMLVETRRYARATAAPALVAAAVALTGVGLTHVGAFGAVATATWVCGLLAALAWLGRNALMAARGPRADERAADRLQVLRYRAAHNPGHLLVAIHDVLWVGPAGQRVHAIDVSRGVMHDIWLPEVALPVGAFAVLDAAANPVRVVDWLDQTTVLNARNCDVRDRAQRLARTARDRRAAAQRETAAVARVVAEAERLLRHAPRDEH